MLTEPTGGGQYSGIPSVARNNIQQIRNFVINRQLWTDDYFNSLTPIERIPCTSLTLSASELVFTEAGSQTLTVVVEPLNTTDKIILSINDDSIATVSNGIVTAIMNDCKVYNYALSDEEMNEFLVS